MVISKCVPLEISRKKFSQFLDPENYTNVWLVGYEMFDDNTKKNVQLKYGDIESSIIRAVKADPEWGQGGGGGGDTPDEPVEKEERNAAIPMMCGFEFLMDDFGMPILDEWGNPSPLRDEDGELIITPSENWDENAQSNIINLDGKKGFVEINGGGNYLEDYIMFARPVIGSVTHIVVDNTGLPIPNPGGRPEEEGVTFEVSKDDFVLYYGRKTDDYSEATLIFRVPAHCRGTVQILHTESTDLILYSSYTLMEERTMFVRDIDDDDTVTNDPIDKTPEGSNDATKFYIDMEQYKGYVEFETGDRQECTFVFTNPELGSSTYIVVDNTGMNYNGYPVTINYGKTMDDGDDSNGKEPDWIELITDVENEKAVIEVFHSLSADIIVKITKV